MQLVKKKELNREKETFSDAIEMFVHRGHKEKTAQAPNGVTGGVVLGLTLLSPFPEIPVEAAIAAELTGVAVPLRLIPTPTIPAISSSLLTIGTPVIATACIRGVSIPVPDGVCILGVPIMAEGGVPDIAEGDCHPGLAPSPLGT